MQPIGCAPGVDAIRHRSARVLSGVGRQRLVEAAAIPMPNPNGLLCIAGGSSLVDKAPAESQSFELFNVLGCGKRTPIPADCAAMRKPSTKADSLKTLPR